MDGPLAPIPTEAEKALPPENTRSGKAARFFLRRYPFWDAIGFFASKKVPEHRHSMWYSMGGVVLFFFAVQVITGVLLMVYYRPSEPWQSVQRIVMEVPFGNVIRSVHFWSAHFMILALFVHMWSTFFMKAYRPPREFTWYFGAALLAATLLFGFSGYLLPWDDLSFFATRVGITELEKAPLVGQWAASLLKGGDDVTVDTIGRFFVLHVTVLPIAVLALVVGHLLFVQLQGVSEPDSFRALPEDKKRYRGFYTDYLLTEIPIWLLLTALLVILAAAAPRAVEQEADPFAAAPEGIKPEWYFLSQYQLLRLFPGKLELVGLILLVFIPLAVLVVPIVDRAVPTDNRGRWATRIGVAAVLAFVGLTIWGWVS